MRSLLLLALLAALAHDGAAMKMRMKGCPLCEDFSACLQACRTHRTEKQDSRFCLTRCGDSHPYAPIRSGFDGPEPPTPEQAAKAWYNKWVKYLDFGPDSKEEAKAPTK
eukprot:TRINITY_DN96431_c0_g1_i1.p1 TRINITY_DN96431_c0_g1~~TRINITY_DN96431_c0_g1_i1.p1  ORF type:complete len:109 (-),score=27.72 TRINITY_DN96431_c0_g1_i1:130-456(-)